MCSTKILGYRRKRTRSNSPQHLCKAGSLMSHTVASINCNILIIEKHTSFFSEMQGYIRKGTCWFSLCRIKPIAFLCTADNRLKQELEVAEGERISTYYSVSIR